MRLERRAPQPDDIYALAGFYFFPLLVLVALAVSNVHAKFLPVCGLKRLSGYPCPTCGAWRALQALSDGKFGSALRCQPLLVGGLFFLALIFVYALATAWGRRPRLFIRCSRRERQIVWLAIGGAVLANWLFLIIDGR